MYRFHTTRVLLAAVVLPLVLAWGCGGSSSSTTDTAGGGIGGTGVSSGPITAFGSIWVNGVRFDVNTATVTINGGAAAAGDLRLGQVVTVEYTGDTATGMATATSVTYDRDLEGPVVIDPTTRTMTMFGQVIEIDTLIDAEDEDGTQLDLASLADDDLLEISGRRDADGILHATRIERKFSGGSGSPEVVEVEGTVAMLTDTTFEIDSLTVDYSGATLDGTLADGVRVDVRGSLTDTGELLADTVTAKGDPSPVGGHMAGTTVEFEGFVTDLSDFATTGELQVDRQWVRVTSSTRFEDVTAADLRLNLRVEVRGVIDHHYVVVADEIQLED
jgi:hypothetical protein